ncbi:MAG: hypothetical protein QXU32_10355 [Nitrososphaerales archaeon]
MNRHNVEITKLLQDPMIAKVVRFIDTSSLSILELLEFGITRKEINHALANNVVRFDKTPDKLVIDVLEEARGDYYFKFLSTKIKLTDLGLLLLQRIKK